MLFLAALELSLTFLVLAAEIVLKLKMVNMNQSFVVYARRRPSPASTLIVNMLSSTLKTFNNEVDLLRLGKNSSQILQCSVSIRFVGCLYVHLHITASHVPVKEVQLSQKSENLLAKSITFFLLVQSLHFVVQRQRTAGKPACRWKGPLKIGSYRWSSNILTQLEFGKRKKFDLIHLPIHVH